LKDWLLRHIVSFGAVTPTKIPFHLMLLGGPKDIPSVVRYETGGCRRPLGIRCSSRHSISRNTLGGAAASRSVLLDVMHGRSKRPALLFTAGPGMGFRDDAVVLVSAKWALLPPGRVKKPMPGWPLVNVESMGPVAL
jgi:hypothetical protein